MGRSKKIQKHRKRRTLRRIRHVKPKFHIGGNNTKYSFITYGDSNYTAAKERIVNQAKGMGCFNGQIKAYGPEDLSKEFLGKIGDIIKESRGAGYWVWKSYIIYDMLNKLNENDILLYADAGCTLRKEGINRLVSYADMISPASGFSVLAMRLKTNKHPIESRPLHAKVWTTSAIFDHFKISLDNPIAKNDQILGGVSMYRKCPESLAVVKKWLDTAEKHPDLFGSKFDEESKKTNPDFIENRHDQAIFNIIVQTPPSNATVKVIEEEIEGSLPLTVPIHASRSKSGGGNDLVSIIIPTYNRFKFLLNTIKSIKAQTYKNIEIIVINDKSTEDEYYKHKFDNDITVIHLPKNSKEIYGYACTGHVRNEGIKVSKGKYIAFCDDDDIWLPSKLELQINAMNNTKCKMSCTDGFIGKGQYKDGDKYEKYNAEHFYDEIRNIYKTKGSTLLENGFPDKWNLEFIKIHNCIITTSVIVSKEVLDRINNFKTIPNKDAEDYDCWLRVLEHTDIAYVKEPCFYYDNNHGSGQQYGGSKPLKLFNIDLHKSVIEDVKANIKELFNSQIEITNYNISNPNDNIQHITQESWRNINMDLISKFQDAHHALLSGFDGFIVTHTPVFAMLYEKYGKPIIVVNSCRYDQPFCWNKDTDMLQKFKDSLKRMQASKQLVMISNNKADQKYLKDGADIDSVYIPSISSYTNAKYNKVKDTFLIFENKIKDKLTSMPNSNKLVVRPSHYEFKDIFEHSGIIHMPYDVTSMSLFEQYFAGVPLFFPTKEFFKECINNKTVDFIVRYDKWGTILSSDEIDRWLADADYYNFKYINYYISFQDCIDKIKSFVDTEKDNRLKHIETVKKDSLDKWRVIFNTVFKFQSGGNITDENQCKYISTRGILKSCDIFSKNLSNTDFNSYDNMKNIKDGSSIYIRSNLFKDFISYFNTLKNKITLVLGDGDSTFPKDFWNNEADFKKFIENPNIICIYAINVNTVHPKLFQYPIGINYHTLSNTNRSNNNKNWGNTMSIQDQENEIEEIRSKRLPFNKRKIKAYSNFHFHMENERTYTQDRRDAKAQISADCIDYEKTPVKRRQTYLNQLEYAYVVCPHGNGLDCHRQWEALLLGCIPIVKTSSIDILYTDLPVLIVKEWTDVTRDLLESKIKEFENKQFNYDRLLLKYWMDKIKGTNI